MTQPTETKNFDRWLRAFRRRWWIVVLCALIAGAAAYVVSTTQRKMYTASSTLLFGNPGFDQMVFGTSLFSQNSSSATGQPDQTDLQLVTLPAVARLTSQALKHKVSAAQIQSEVSVHPVGQSEVANIEVSDPDRARAALIATTYAQEYISFRRSADRADIKAAQQTVRRQLGRLSKQARTGSVGASVENRANQLRVLSALQTGDAQLMQPASVPTSPSSPKTKRNLLIGVLLGLILGIGVAAMVEWLDRRLRDPEALEAAFGIPVLGVVPRDAAFADPQRSTSGGPSEVFSLLRARLRYFNVDREVRSLLITSSVAGEGKTTVSMNLAFSEAAAGTKVVLVEADLRRPTIASVLNLDAAPGLSEALTHSASLDASLRTVPVPGRSDNGHEAPVLSVLPSGAIPPNPAELIESQAMADLLSTLTERFELVILDSPPVSLVSDPIPLIKRVDGLLVVCRIGVTNRDGARSLRQQLENLDAPALGLVANAMPGSGSEYYAYYGRAERSESPNKQPSESRALARNR